MVGQQSTAAMAGKNPMAHMARQNSTADMAEQTIHSTHGRKNKIQSKKSTNTRNTHKQGNKGPRKHQNKDPPKEKEYTVTRDILANVLISRLSLIREFKKREKLRDNR